MNEKPDRYVTDLNVAVRQLEAIAKRIVEIQRRDSESVGPDGYGSQGGDSRHAKGDHSDPTFRAATGLRTADRVHEHTVNLLDAVRAACDAANSAAGYLTAIDTHVDRHLGRPNLVEQCPVCNDPMPQPRAGFCEPCYRRWARLGRPERAPWVNQERQRLASREEGAA